MAPYFEIFAVTMVINVIVTFFSSSSGKKYVQMLPCCFASYRNVPSSEQEADIQESSNDNNDDDRDQVKMHKNLLSRYLTVYLLATMCDWFQGPYVYALYSAYEYAQHDIAILFVAGFGSSMIFGSFIGGMADKGGRRKYVIVYSILYAGSCMTKHFNNYWMLMVGRLLGGIATSLLFSVFDSWLIKAHTVAKLDSSFISKSYAAAAYGNSVVAIVTGLVANNLASSTEMHPLIESANFYVGGYLRPFDAAFFGLIICAVLTSFTWDENYGERIGEKQASPTNGSPEFVRALQSALSTTMNDTDIFRCGMIASLFEGSMYIFVFMWTPMLTNLTDDGEEDNLPFGLIFSTFMVGCMIGSSIFSILIERIRCEVLGAYVFLIGSLSMAVIYCSSSDTLCIIGMTIFEVCVGMYFPIMGTMKSEIVPESQRAAIYNVYRIPLNFIVVTSLLVNLAPEQAFVVTGAMLALAAFFQSKLSESRIISASGSESQFV